MDTYGDMLYFHKSQKGYKKEKDVVLEDIYGDIKNNDKGLRNNYIHNFECSDTKVQKQNLPN